MSAPIPVSPFLESALRRAGLDADLFHSPDLPRRLRSVANDLRPQAESGDFGALRRLRAVAMARIALRALNGTDGVERTLAATSTVALRCIRMALNVAASQYDLPSAPCVFAMGKLGGFELNFSSDVDLIFTHVDVPEDTDESDLAAKLHERLARDVAKQLSEVTEDGFVFRVDTQLRPFGSVGALSLPFSVVEHYYQTHGREWERYALIKGRPIAGDVEAGWSLLEALRPFVYRRYFDFDAVANLRELKQKIAEDARTRGHEDDLKVGPGGIREIEFIVQLFQLMRGGQDRCLRDSRLLPTLRYLGEAGFLPTQTARSLEADYLWLRRCENAVQMWEDRQTHRLPQEAAAQAFVCAAMGLPDWNALLEQHAALRQRVADEFARTFGESEHGHQVPVIQRAAAALLAGEDSTESAANLLRECGLSRHPQRIAAIGADLSRLRRNALIGDRGWQRLKTLLPDLLTAALEMDDPDEVLVNALPVIVAIAGRTTYLSLLSESDTARQELLRLCAASPWIANEVARTPALLDGLLDPRSLYAPPTRADLERDLAVATRDVPAGDTESEMDVLRKFRQESMLQIAASDISGVLPLVEVSDRLTWLAEVVLGQALTFAYEDLSQLYGRPAGVDVQRLGLAVIGYGKLGGIEMGYGSDLDIIFLYQCDDPQEMTQGAARSCGVGQFYTRLVQRVIQQLSMRTARGRAYEVDLELRPSGRSGPLVSRVPAFRHYQLESAWTWESQALLRARPVAGDGRVMADFTETRRDALTRPRDVAALRRAVISMREKMRKAQPVPEQGCWDIKHGSGGLIDAEFVIQYLCLRHAAAHPEVIEYSDNWRQIEVLSGSGILIPEDAASLIDALRSLRGGLHRRALREIGSTALPSDHVREREVIERCWQRYLAEVE